VVNHPLLARRARHRRACTAAAGDFRLDALQPRFGVARLPYSLTILLESLLLSAAGKAATTEDIEALADGILRLVPRQLRGGA
jgi:aconitase A